jgi:pimeloyl-ACP methyl ester carboxylesterase
MPVRPMNRLQNRSLIGYLTGAATVVVAGILIAAAPDSAGNAQPPTVSVRAIAPAVHYRTVKIDGLDIAYREAGPKDAPTILLLHGFPTSSHMFRNIIPALADKYRVIAPDYPGFGNSSMPKVNEFEYSFDNLATTIDKFTRAVGAETFVMYVQDYGAPVGYRIAAANPQRIKGLIVQNGNAYDEGLEDFWVPLKTYWKDQSPENTAALTKFLELDATKWQWTHGVGDVSRISPDTWNLDQLGLDRPGNKEIQLTLFLSYGTNPPLYPAWQEYFRTHQPPTLIVWGKNDHIFPASGAEPYKRDLKNIDFNLLDTGHFALEEKGPEIVAKIREFMATKVK